MTAKRAKRTTKATLGKLGRALVELESFIGADDVMSVIDHSERQELWTAIRTIQTLESRLYNGGQS